MSAVHGADSCVVGAICLFSMSLATIDTVIQIIAGSLTALAALASLILHIQSWLAKRRARK